MKFGNRTWKACRRLIVIRAMHVGWDDPRSEARMWKTLAAKFGKEKVDIFKREIRAKQYARFTKDMSHHEL